MVASETKRKAAASGWALVISHRFFDAFHSNVVEADVQRKGKKFRVKVFFLEPLGLEKFKSHSLNEGKAPTTSKASINRYVDLLRSTLESSAVARGKHRYVLWDVHTPLPVGYEWVGSPPSTSSPTSGLDPSEMELLADIDPEVMQLQRSENTVSDAASAGARLYIATMITPGRVKRPYMAFWDSDGYDIGISQLMLSIPVSSPEAARRLGYPRARVTPGIVGSGYFDESILPGTGCLRTHTPDGVSCLGVGMGWLLYSAMALYADLIRQIDHDPHASHLIFGPMNAEKCVGSIDDESGRSRSAAAFWWGAAKRGSARVWSHDGSLELPHDHEVAGRVGRTGLQQTLDSVAVFASGTVIDWNPALDNPWPNKPSLKTLLQVKFDQVFDPLIISWYANLLRFRGATDRQIKKWAKTTPIDERKALDARVMDPFVGFRNPALKQYQQPLVVSGLPPLIAPFNQDWNSLDDMEWIDQEGVKHVGKLQDEALSIKDERSGREIAVMWVATEWGRHGPAAMLIERIKRPHRWSARDDPKYGSYKLGVRRQKTALAAALICKYPELRSLCGFRRMGRSLTSAAKGDCMKVERT